MNFIFGQEKKFFEFISNLSDKDKIGIISHNDLDGIVSAVIMSKILGKIDYIQFIDYNPKEFINIISELKKNKINKTVFLDLNFGGSPDFFKEIVKFSEILFLDHHESVDVNSEKIVYLRTESKIPACAICSYFALKMIEIPGFISALGIISDRVDRYNSQNNQDVFEDFGLRGKIELWEYEDILNFARIYLRNDLQKIYDFLMNIKKIEEIKGLEKYAEPVKKEFESCLEDFYKNKKEFGDIIFYEFSPKYNIKSSLINRISTENQNRVLIFASVSGDNVFISTRCFSARFNCIKILKRLTRGIEVSSGGHIVAAGCLLDRQQYEKFKENLGS